jgi:hypothetical protein
MGVSIEKTKKGYEVVINGKTITLPSKSKWTESKGGFTKLGTGSKYLKIDTYSNAIDLIEKGESNKVIVPDDDENENERYQTFGDLRMAWEDIPKKGGSRLDVKTRRAKRHGGNYEGGKLRKLTTRRR